MYNLTVNTSHTFFVGDGQWLVHNCDPVAFGMQRYGLQGFADKQGAKTFADLGLNPNSPTFAKDLVNAMTNAKSIEFNLNGMQDVGELIRNPAFGVAAGSTNWELQVVTFTSELRAKATFHLGDTTYTYAQLLKAFPWSPK